MYRQCLSALAMLTLASACVVEPAHVAVRASLTVREAPPPLPFYEQPPCPDEGFLWTPGYWAWGVEGYYWIPGTWIRPPRVGLLWTPGYWGWNESIYVFHAGYWGPHVGFYGGVVYGGGYVGTGYVGGRWVSNNFVYNTAVTQVNTTVVHNTYHETVINNVTVNNTTVKNVSYNGGPSGTRAAPTETERVAERETHVQPTTQQVQHMNDASRNRALLAHVNQGHPAIAATPHASAFNAPGVARAIPPRSVESNNGQAAANNGANNAQQRERAERPAQAKPQSAYASRREQQAREAAQRKSAREEKAKHSDKKKRDEKSRDKEQER